jgi:transcriptional regulator with XRE-family HTH domain
MLHTLDSLPSNGIQLAEWRAGNSITQRQVSKIVGASQELVSRWERDNLTLHRIARERLLNWLNNPAFVAPGPLPRRNKKRGELKLVYDPATGKSQYKEI